MNATGQHHCPYDGRWVGNPHGVCARPECEDRFEAEVSAIVEALEKATVVYTLVARGHDAADVINAATRSVGTLLEKARASGYTAD